MATISDLPTEILEQITNDLRTDELYTLALLSQRLHRLALTIYLRRYGIVELHVRSPSIFIQNYSLNALPGLQIALFITSLQTLSCTFNSSLTDLFNDMNRLTRIVLKLAEVKEIIIDFQFVDEWTTRFGLWPMSARALASAFGDLLAAAAKRSCVKLSIQHGRCFTTYVKSDAKKMRLPMTTVVTRTLNKTFSRLMHQASTSAAETPPLEISYPTFACLQSLEIHCSILTAPHLKGRMNHLSSTSTITTLSLRDLPLENAERATILSQLQLPSLTKFSIIGAYTAFDFPTFENFLSRHPTIVSLNFDGYHFMPSSPQFPCTLIPKTITLTASPRCISQLLAAPNALPALQSVTIVHYPSYGVDSEEISKSFASISKRLETVNLTFKLVLHSSYMMLDTSEDDYYYLATPVLRNVKFMEVTTSDGGVLNVAISNWLPVWLRLLQFPILQRLSFTGHLPFDDYSMRDFVKSLRDVCPGLEVDSLDSEVHKISDSTST